MGFPDRPEPKSEHIEKPFKEIEKQFKEDKDKESIKAEHKDFKETKETKENVKAEHKDTKETIKAEHKDFKEFKAELKDVKEFKAELKAEIKEQVEKPIIKEKDKDKEVFEGGGFEQPGGDPLALLHSLHARISSIEEQLGLGAQAFVQPEERPPVGGSVAKQAKERPSKTSQAGKGE